MKSPPSDLHFGHALSDTLGRRNQQIQTLVNCASEEGLVEAVSHDIRDTSVKQHTSDLRSVFF